MFIFFSIRLMHSPNSSNIKQLLELFLFPFCVQKRKKEKANNCLYTRTQKGVSLSYFFVEYLTKERAGARNSPYVELYSNPCHSVGRHLFFLLLLYLTFPGIWPLRQRFFCFFKLFRVFFYFTEMENMIKERYGIVDRDYRLMEVMVLKGAPHYAGKQWKFAGAFYYATTVLTTIGIIM